MIMNSLYDQSYVLADGNTPAMIPDADGLVSFTTLLCPGEASTPDPESISKEYDELPIIELKDLPPDQVIDPAHEATEDDYGYGPDYSEEIKAAADKVCSRYYDEEDLDSDD
jgi:hypothetical protein